ncbi:DgyrCDS1444 [Dimorphilus gyrociliatus]|uniref:DgyrCDS1444 n=1 Tax=Dimorphilus gyrociliatus TaxID=2664684 RepID=A0A7I8VAI7_9ANNE|nr:DgyrCDS1444 [Dimorphilus gyrociliatus]
MADRSEEQKHAAGDNKNFPASTAQMDSLATKIQNLDLSNAKQSDFDTFQQVAMNIDGFDKEMVDVIAGNLFNFVSKNWLLAENASHLCKALCSSDSQFSDDFRAIFLTKLQAGYMARAEQRNTDIGLGYAAILCQFYANVFLKDGSRISTLIQPILDTLHMLTDWNATDQEILVASRQLMAIGPLLENERRLSDIFRTIENRVIDATGSEDARRKLLSVVKAKSSNWQLREEILKKWEPGHL